MLCLILSWDEVRGDGVLPPPSLSLHVFEARGQGGVTSLRVGLRRLLARGAKCQVARASHCSSVRPAAEGMSY